MGKNCLVFNYKFKDIDSKNRFKNLVRRSGDTMQSSISRFVDMVIGRRFVMEDIFVSVAPIKNDVVEFEHFFLNAVSINNAAPREFHIKPKANSTLKAVADFFQKMIPDGEVGYESFFALEFPVWVKVKMDIDFKKVFGGIDTEITNFIKESSYGHQS